MPRTVTSLEGYIRKISKLPQSSDKVIYYRGHSDGKLYKLEPSLFRNTGWTANEQVLVSEILSSNPSDFKDDRSMFEKLVRMQHHFLPTRLLDITSNPLMALYFACGEPISEGGEVIAISVGKKSIKYSDSDTVSCIANLARLTAPERAGINAALPPEQFNADKPIMRLHHFIKEEKPYFEASINPHDLTKIVCVKPKLSNQRIQSQSGSFLLFGLSAKLPEGGNSDYHIDRIKISAKSKKKILDELAVMNVHRGTIYPNIESSAIVVKESYRTP